MNKLFGFLAVAVVIVALLTALVWAIWQGILMIPINVVRLWALLITAAVPFVTWAAWWFGHTEARGRLTGLDQAIDKMFGGLSKAAGLNVSSVRAMRQVTHQEPPVVLPDVEIVQRRLTSGQEEIEL